MTEKRDESPRIWIDATRVNEVATEGCDCVGHMSAAKQLPGDIEYVPYSALESVTRERDAAVRRMGELELAAGHAMELHERWCNCDIEELSNAMTVLDQVLHEESSDA